MKKVIVYDLDDTLYRERDFVFSGFKAVDSWLKTNHQISGFFSSAVSLFKKGIRGVVFNNALKELQIDETPELINAMISTYRQHTPLITLLPEVKETLPLHSNSFHQAIITDGYYLTQKNKIEALGLHKIIPLILCSDQFGHNAWKPSPITYQKVMQHFKLPGEACTYVGDNPKKDFITAKKLGWQTIRIIRDGYEHATLQAETPEHEAHTTIISFYELDNILSSASLDI